MCVFACMEEKGGGGGAVNMDYICDLLLLAFCWFKSLLIVAKGRNENKSTSTHTAHTHGGRRIRIRFNEHNNTHFTNFTLFFWHCRDKKFQEIISITIACRTKWRQRRRLMGKCVKSNDFSFGIWSWEVTSKLKVSSRYYQLKNKNCVIRLRLAWGFVTSLDWINLD